MHHREHESRCSVDTLECVVTAGHALWSIMAQLMDGRPLAIGQAAGFHSCGQDHRDHCRPASGEQTETSGQRFERRYVSTREAGTVHTSGMRERRAAILGDRCSLGPECCGSASLLRPTLSFAMVLPAASDTASQVVTLARAQHQMWTQRRMGRCRRLPRRRGDVDVCGALP